jgi:3-hydroxybutyrate dehydrogenase
MAAFGFSGNTSEKVYHLPCFLCQTTAWGELRLRLSGRVALVTGAASGIGLEIARAMAREGASVVLADIAVSAAQIAAREIDTSGAKALAVAMDVTSEQQVSAGIEKTIATFGNLDILVSNAGIQHIAPIHELEFSDWRRVVAIHLDGAFLTTRAALRHMYAHHSGGTIVYLGSVHSKEASPLKAPYVAAKHALLGLCRTVAKEGAAFGVRANVICPGFVRTPLVEKQIPEQAAVLGLSESEVVRNVMLKETIDGEFTTTQDVANCAVFFATFPTNALSGQSVVVSHGWHMQ